MPELDISSILLIALGLSADCFAVAISGSISMQYVSRFQVFRTALTFGIFQALMPVLGWLAGRTIVNFIADYDHWVAFSLLALVGARMIWGSAHKKEERGQIDITKGFLLLMLALATSIDAFAVGLTFAFLKVNIVLASFIIGTVAFFITTSGFLLGRKTGKFTGQRAETIGGVILIIIGVRIILVHIL